MASSYYELGKLLYDNSLYQLEIDEKSIQAFRIVLQHSYNFSTESNFIEGFNDRSAECGDRNYSYDEIMNFAALHKL